MRFYSNDSHQMVFLVQGYTISDIYERMFRCLVHGGFKLLRSAWTGDDTSCCTQVRWTFIRNRLRYRALVGGPDGVGSSRRAICSIGRTDLLFDFNVSYIGDGNCISSTFLGRTSRKFGRKMK